MNNVELRAAAEAATRETDPWGYERDAFTDAFTPDVVLGLLDELARLRAALEDIEANTCCDETAAVATAALATPPDATHGQVIE